jgi:hypothetical protein
LWGERREAGLKRGCKEREEKRMFQIMSRIREKRLEGEKEGKRGGEEEHERGGWSEEV